MGQRFAICTALANGATGSWVRLRAASVPFRLMATGGYTGDVTIQHTPDGGTTVFDLDTLASGGEIGVDHPVREIRVDGDHSAGTATVYLIDDVKA